MTTSVVSSLAITALVLLFSCKPSVAHRKLYGGENAPNPAACGFFDSSDLRDSGVAHQPCFGPDNSVLFCCTSGSSKCSCPIQGSLEYGCYNYESNSTLNAITGEECGYFLPSEKPRSVAMRRELADNCNGNYTICPSTCGPRADLVFFNDLPLAPGVLGCEYENDKSGTDMYDTAECAYFINDGSVDTGFSSPCCDGTQSICALNTPAPTTPAPTTPAPTTPAPTTPAPTTPPTTPTPTTPAPTTPAPTTPDPTTPPPTIPAPTTPAPTTPAPTPVSTTPGPTATNAPTATPGAFPVGGTCDPFSAFPNQCFNTDGSLYTCCMGPCFSGAPGVVPSCTTNSLTQEPTPGPTTTPAPTNPPPSVFPVGGICDASSALPNQCFNSNGDLFTCCPGQCPDTSTASPACATAGGSAPVPTATGSESATPVPTPAPLTCDDSSNLPNQCFNSDGSRFVCCPSACVATPTLDAVCGPVR